MPKSSITPLQAQQPLSFQHKNFFQRHATIYLYIPNLIGYLRVAFALYAFSVARTDPARCFLFYFASFVCDELDGRCARMFNQSSTFGAVLDMVTDRVATSCLIAVLCTHYPLLQPIFLALLMLDIFSHWFQMYATLAMGSSTHKDTNSRSFIVRFYYKHRIFMGFCCVCVEALYLFIYLLAFDEYRTRWAIVTVPRLVQSVLPASVVLSSGRVSVLVLFVVLVVPGFVIKQIINVVQLRTAAEQLVAYDQRNSNSNVGGVGVVLNTNNNGDDANNKDDGGRRRSASAPRSRSTSRRRR